MKEYFDIIQQLLDSCVKGGAFTKADDVCRVQNAIEELKKEVYLGFSKSDRFTQGDQEQQPG